MKPEEIAAMSITELDELIAALAKERASRPEKVSDKPPDAIEPVEYTAWWCQMLHNGNTLLRLRHPGLGWLNFGFNHANRAQMLTLWLQHSLVFPVAILEAKEARQPPPAPQGGGSGTLH